MLRHQLTDDQWDLIEDLFPAPAATGRPPRCRRQIVDAILAAWRSLRGSLERRQAVRTMGRRFRKDPVAYLKSLEDSLINQILPPWVFSA